ncbi:DUF6114 domain-containing protein [Actinokineospora inagensis]|uniref:DUF6114 domain-containing protein n=1 Tax=Actinokineospora inagensis TaxID=103730 RepID=UPI003CCBAA7F
MQTRVIAGPIAVLVAVAAFPLTNLGGLFLGSLFGAVGARWPRRGRRARRSPLRSWWPERTG